MKLSKTAGIWVSILLFVFLSVTVFYLSFILEKKSLPLSLFGLFFVLFMGLLAIILEIQIESKNCGLWVRTIISLFLTNIIIFVILIVILPGTVSHYLAFSISYSLLYCLFTFIISKLDSK